MFAIQVRKRFPKDAPALDRYVKKRQLVATDPFTNQSQNPCQSYPLHTTTVRGVREEATIRCHENTDGG